MEQQILTITQVNEYIRSRMDADPLLMQIAVKGEISNYKRYPSGHHYFTLKDENAALKCVIFKGSAMRLRFQPENGMKVIALGRITVFPRDGAFQLYCTSMTVDGLGDLHVAFEQLKAKLMAQGLFDPAHKKPIPAFPKTIGIITSSAGAAVHDMLRILNKRFPMCKVRLLPVRVQGEEAPAEIAAAIGYANHFCLADVLIVGRGGGSIEDLWAFNDERVAYAIFRSEIPIISAVGHEPDVTISDYVADLRAATPSNAAELVVPDQDALRQSLDGAFSGLVSAMGKQIHSAQQKLDMLCAAAVLREPTAYLDQKQKQLEFLSNRMVTAQERIIHRHGQRFTELASKLDAMSPLKVISRGYAITQKEDGSIIRSVKDVAADDLINVVMADGTLMAAVTGVKEQGND